jgi:RNA polymerase sigma factor (sigma-70 family)
VTSKKNDKAIKTKIKVSDYLELVERVAKVEYRRVPSHMVDYQELVNIGAMAIQALIKNKTSDDMSAINISYMATAIRWAIRNELRSRYKWYTLKHSKAEEAEDAHEESAEGEEGVSGDSPSTGTVREAVYETILSIEGISEGSEGDSPYEFIKDASSTPEEHLEVIELGRAIKKAIEALPPKERAIMEYRFYRNMQVKDIASLVGLSSSRITRIVQSSLDLVRDYLRESQHIE